MDVDTVSRMQLSALEEEEINNMFQLELIDIHFQPGRLNFKNNQ